MMTVIASGIVAASGLPVNWAGIVSGAMLGVVGFWVCWSY